MRVGICFRDATKRLTGKKTTFLDLARYVVLNSVSADKVMKPEEWAWSNYHAPIAFRVLYLLLEFGKDKG
jgi:hypothetical protein